MERWTDVRDESFLMTSLNNAKDPLQLLNSNMIFKSTQKAQNLNTGILSLERDIKKTSETNMHVRKICQTQSTSHRREIILTKCSPFYDTACVREVICGHPKLPLQCVILSCNDTTHVISSSPVHKLF